MAESTGKKNKGTLIFLILLAVVFVVTLGYTFVPIHKSEAVMAPVFNGWIYLREDQKTANAAMAKAKLTQYQWKDGELSVPREERSRYETVLAEVKAFPRAPGDVKREALREMSQFEPVAKMKLRDLYSAGWQLEQTIEHFSTQINYATVGVRSRPEQRGMIQKNVVTASVGIWPKDDTPLTTELLSAITLATKHHLGITENTDISILDLRHGCSYLGTDAGVTAPLSKEARNEHLRQEFWNEKFLIAFRHIPGIKVSTSIVRPVARTAPQLTPTIQQKQVEPARPKTFAVLGNRLPTTLVSRPATNPVPATYASGQGKMNTTYGNDSLSIASMTQTDEPKQLVCDTPGTETASDHEDESKISVEIGIPEEYVRETIVAGTNKADRQFVAADEVALKGREIAASVKKEATGLLREVFTTKQAALDDESFVHVSILPTAGDQTAISSAGNNATVLEKPVRANDLTAHTPSDFTAKNPIHTVSVSNEDVIHNTEANSNTSHSLEARLIELWNANKRSPLFWTLAIILSFVVTATVLASASFLFRQVTAIFYRCFGTREKTNDKKNMSGIDDIEDTLELRHDMPEEKPAIRNVDEATTVINQWLRAG